jgi:fructose-1,6-bisphosphatase
MIKDKDNVTLDDVMQPGTNMLAAGYCMYGSSCTVIMLTGSVFLLRFFFTLLPELTAVVDYGSLC